MDIFKTVFRRKQVVADVQTEADIAELQQVKAKKALRDAAIAAVQNSLRIGAISKAQAALIEAHMKNNPSPRTILEELISTLESNGEIEHLAVAKEMDAIFKSNISEGR